MHTMHTCEQHTMIILYMFEQQTKISLHVSKPFQCRTASSQALCVDTSHLYSADNVYISDFNPFLKHLVCFSWKRRRKIGRERGKEEGKVGGTGGEQRGRLRGGGRGGRRGGGRGGIGSLY